MRHDIWHQMIRIRVRHRLNWVRGSWSGSRQDKKGHQEEKRHVDTLLGLWRVGDRGIRESARLGAKSLVFTGQAVVQGHLSLTGDFSWSLNVLFRSSRRNICRFWSNLFSIRRFLKNYCHEIKTLVWIRIWIASWFIKAVIRIQWNWIWSIWNTEDTSYLA